MYEELLAKAKEAKDEKELYEMAKKEGIELTEDSVKSLYRRLHSEGELSDDDLDSVSGGGCQVKINNHNYTMVTCACKCFTGKWEDSLMSSDYYARRKDNIRSRKFWYNFSSEGQCGHCIYLEFNTESGASYATGLGFCGLT